MGDNERACAVAVMLLTGVGTRLAHSRRAAEQAAVVAALLDAPWAAALLSAAWLHDVGYAPSVASTGFHPLDGARWLSAHDWSEEVCRLVAWHTRAGTEAALRDRLGALRAEFPPPPVRAAAALTWADLTAAPTGESCLPLERIAEILGRYAPESEVHVATTTNLPELLADVRLIEDLLPPPRAEL